MKKLLAVMSLGMLVLSMAACGGKDTSDKNQSTEQTSENQTGSTDTSQENNSNQENGAADTEAVDVSNGWSSDMQQIKDAVVAALGDNYWPDTPIVPEMLEAIYGISPDLYEDYLGESPMISGNVDTLLIIKAKDDKVEAVQDAMNTYRDNLVNDTMQYPMNVGKIQASRIERIGNYICFVQLGADTMADFEDDEEAVIVQCQEQNELVLEIIRQNIPE